MGRRPFAGVERQHGDEPVGEALRHLGVPLILLGEDVVEAPRLQLCDVTELAWGRKRTRFSMEKVQSLLILNLLYTYVASIHDHFIFIASYL